MDKRPDIEKRIEKTLESLDGMKRAEPQAFFFTRLMARLEKDQKSWWESTGAFLAKPVMVAVCLCLILVFNAFILFNQDSETEQNGTAAAIDNVSENEFIVASNSSFDFENLDQQ